MGPDKQNFKPVGKGILGKLEFFFSPLKNPTRVLAIKDIKLFWRDPTQWSQFIIFFGIMAVYFANLHNISAYYSNEVRKVWVAYINLASITLILATLTSRFIFPLISLEGRRFWIIGLSPISIKQLVWQKFWLSVALTSAFMILLTALSGIMLRLNSFYLFLTIYSALTTSIGLSGLAIGLGTLYPTFTEDNVARIVSGMGGTLNFIISVIYTLLVIIIQTKFILRRLVYGIGFPELTRYEHAIGLILITILCISCVLIPIKLGIRNLKQLEF